MPGNLATLLVEALFAGCVALKTEKWPYVMQLLVLGEQNRVFEEATVTNMTVAWAMLDNRIKERPEVYTV